MWTSCGGGSGDDPAAGDQLNVTIGGAALAGALTADSGDTVTFGFFSDDIN